MFVFQIYKNSVGEKKKNKDTLKKTWFFRKTDLQILLNFKYFRDNYF